MSDETALAEYENMVRYLARRTYGRLSGVKRAAIDLCDLQQAGRIGLLLAARSYNPALGEFKPRAGFMIERAILDTVRGAFHGRRENQISFVAIDEARYVATDCGIDTRIDAQRALAKLSRRQRAVVVSAFWDGRTAAETASEMGITVCNVAWIKQDALRGLRAA